MHAEAFQWIAEHAPLEPVNVLDLGGRDINGSARSAFTGGYTVLDIADGPGVDIVADAATWQPDMQWDVVVCAETFEHTGAWPAIVRTAHAALKPGGRLILTMAGTGRPPHSGIDGGWDLHPGEHYANIHPERLRAVLERTGFVDVKVDQQVDPADVRAAARKPEEVP
jgi:predicted TPR repeat methyltransferase